MKNLLKILSFLGLAGVITLSRPLFFTWVEKPAMSLLMLLGTILWFTTSLLWIGRKA